jgi:hypothetical protein
MRMKNMWFVGALVMAAIAPTRAAADSAGLAATSLSLAPQGERRHFLRLDMGFLSAVGFGGFSYAFAPISALQLETAVGAGGTGVQLSLMPKLTLGSARHKFVAGVGLSAGLGGNAIKKVDPAAFFVNAEIGYQFVARGGFTFAVTTGTTTALNGQYNAGFQSKSDASAVGLTLPQIRVGFGYAF